MSKLQRYEHVSDYIGARMEKDEYGDWCDADEVDSELRRVGLLLKAAHHLLMAATGPEGGPTNWNDTRQEWIDRAKQFFPEEATGDETV